MSPPSISDPPPPPHDDYYSLEKKQGLDGFRAQAATLSIFVCKDSRIAE